MFTLDNSVRPPHARKHCNIAAREGTIDSFLKLNTNKSYGPDT